MEDIEFNPDLPRGIDATGRLLYLLHNNDQAIRLTVPVSEALVDLAEAHISRVAATADNEEVVRAWQDYFVAAVKKIMREMPDKDRSLEDLHRDIEELEGVSPQAEAEEGATTSASTGPDNRSAANNDDNNNASSSSTIPGTPALPLEVARPTTQPFDSHFIVNTDQPYKARITEERITEERVDGPQTQISRTIFDFALRTPARVGVWSQHRIGPVHFWSDRASQGPIRVLRDGRVVRGVPISVPVAGVARGRGQGQGQGQAGSVVDSQTQTQTQTQAQAQAPEVPAIIKAPTFSLSSTSSQEAPGTTASEAEAGTASTLHGAQGQGQGQAAAMPFFFDEFPVPDGAEAHPTVPVPGSESETSGVFDGVGPFFQDDSDGEDPPW